MQNNQYKNEYMFRIVRYIEDNLHDAINAEDLVRIGSVSHAQLYRDFYNLTGHPVKEYIRKRRLSNALALIKASDFPLADIACQCGYSSQQALCRAVRQTLGTTPLAYKNGEMTYYYPTYKGDALQPVTVSGETLPPMVCFRYCHGCEKDIEIRAVNTFLKLIPNYNGRIFGRNGKEQDNRYSYNLYLSDLSRDYSALETHGFIRENATGPFTALFAQITVKNREDQINKAWNYLYHIWLQHSMFEQIKGVFYEEYMLRRQKPAAVRVYLPIQKRLNETKMTIIPNPGLCFVAAKGSGPHAEKEASKKVSEYLWAHYPYILKTAKAFFLHQDKDSCVCGVHVQSGLRMMGDDILLIITDSPRYLLLTSRVMGDYGQYAAQLLSFASQNHITADRKRIFAVYETRDDPDMSKLKMYCPIEDGNGCGF